MRLSKALSIIIGSTLLISGSTYFVLHAYRIKLQNRLQNPDYFISLIVQTGPEKNALPTHYLAELMDLSFDQPTNLYAFSSNEAKNKLLNSPLIQSANVKPIKPSAIYVEYKVRVPILTLAEYPNIGVDKTGHLFPIEPYLTPKNLPQLILGKPLSAPIFDQQIDMTLINQLIEQTNQTELQRIDLSDIQAKSAGRRQIVMIANNHTLRLTPKNYQKELQNYFKLCQKLEENADESSKVIDFRIDDMAFMEKIDD